MCSLEKHCPLFILRLNPTLLDAISSAINHIRSDPSASQSVLITTADGKFFSNGYDHVFAKTNPSLLALMDLKLRSVVTDLISLLMPTIAAVTGHASGAGFILSMSHDYILMRRDRGFLYMSELDIELKVVSWFMALIRMKIGSPATWRDVMLTAAKLTADKGLEMGIVDSVHGSAAETVEAPIRLGEEVVKRECDGHVYGRMRETMLSEVLQTIGSEERPSCRERTIGSKL